MNVIRRRGFHRVRIGGAGLAAYSLLSSQIFCGVAWCAGCTFGPFIDTCSPCAGYHTVAPAPLAGLSFLIVALDDAELARATAKIGAPVASPPAIPPVAVPDTGGPASGVKAPGAPAITPLTPGTEKTQLPQEKVPAPPAAPIQPAVGHLFPQRLWTVQSLALQSSRLAKAKVEEPPLTLTPEPRQNALPEAPFGATILPTVPATGATNTTAPDSTGFGALVPARVNRALSLSVPLRRALVKAGSPDVLDTGFDGAPILRALNNHRLSSRTLDALVDAVAQVMQTGKVGADDPSVKAAAQTAARIGRASTV